MDVALDSFNDILIHLSWLARTVVNGSVWALTGQFIPQSCSWCRPAWMIGLGMGVVLILFYMRGPKTD